MERTFEGVPLVSGEAEGDVLGTSTPLSFWGGYDPKSGEVIDRRHPLSGQSAKGKVLALRFVRGSSTSTAILLEAIREGTAPAALVTTGSDPFMVLAVVVAEELFGQSMPVISVSEDAYEEIAGAEYAWVFLDGTVRIH